MKEGTDGVLVLTFGKNDFGMQEEESRLERVQNGIGGEELQTENENSMFSELKDERKTGL